jgi:hypothetical protein
MRKKWMRSYSEFRTILLRTSEEKSRRRWRGGYRKKAHKSLGTRAPHLESVDSDSLPLLAE